MLVVQQRLAAPEADGEIGFIVLVCPASAPVRQIG